MPTRDRRLDRAVHRSRELIDVAARDLMLARTNAGLSQADAGRSVGISRSQLGRIERGELRNVTLEQLCRAAAAVGLRGTFRLFPDGDPLRDTAQTRLLGRLRPLVPALVGWRLEVGLFGQPDSRAWDCVLTFPDGQVAVEAETRIRDAQALWRRISLKLRDDRTIGHVILVVGDTPANRRAVTAVRHLLRADLPLDTRQVLHALRLGQNPGASGIVFL
jgi:transcriptional regulator with XRE-family HTH domain